MDTPQKDGWSTERGYSVPPPASGRNIVNEPMKFGPVRIGQNTFPGSGTPQAPTKAVDKDDVKDSEETLKGTPESSTVEQSAEVLSNIPLPYGVGTSPTPRFASTQSVQIEWQGCKFNVTFDDVWAQADPSSPETTKWLVLVHDLNKNAGGPTWTPPTSTTSTSPTTLTMYHDDTKYVCAYFGLELLIPVCNLSLTVFLVTG